MMITRGNEGFRLDLGVCACVFVCESMCFKEFVLFFKIFLSHEFLESLEGGQGVCFRLHTHTYAHSLCHTHMRERDTHTHIHTRT